MGQIPTGSCAKCDSLAVPHRNKCWTNYCDDCYLEMSKTMSTKSCTRCKECLFKPVIRHLVIADINNITMRECSDCRDDRLSHNTERKYCDECLENKYYRKATQCTLCDCKIYHVALRYCRDCKGPLCGEEPEWLQECETCYVDRNWSWNVPVYKPCSATLSDTTQADTLRCTV